MSAKNIKSVEIIERYEGEKSEVISLVAYDESGEVVDTIFSIPQDPHVIIRSTPKGKNYFYEYSKNRSDPQSQGNES